MFIRSVYIVGKCRINDVLNAKIRWQISGRNCKIYQYNETVPFERPMKQYRAMVKRAGTQGMRMSIYQVDDHVFAECTMSR